MSLTEAAQVAQAIPEGWTRESMRHAAQNVRRALILKTLWYPELLNGMVDSARQYLESAGVSASAIEVRTVPGSFELPLGVEICAPASPGRPAADLVVALGCIIKGDTPHFDFVSGAATDGLMRVQLDQRVPVGFGVLTVENREQAEARIGKGAEAAQAAFMMHLLARQSGRRLQGPFQE